MSILKKNRRSVLRSLRKISPIGDKRVKAQYKASKKRVS